MEFLGRGLDWDGGGVAIGDGVRGPSEVWCCGVNAGESTLSGELVPRGFWVGVGAGVMGLVSGIMLLSARWKRRGWRDD